MGRSKKAPDGTDGQDHYVEPDDPQPDEEIDGAPVEVPGPVEPDPEVVAAEQAELDERAREQDNDEPEAA